MDIMETSTRRNAKKNKAGQLERVQNKTRLDSEQKKKENDMSLFLKLHTIVLNANKWTQNSHTTNFFQRK